MSLGLDACSASLERLVKATGKLGQTDRKKLINEIDKHLRSAANQLERNRISGARLLVVCLPHSTPVIDCSLLGTGETEELGIAEEAQQRATASNAADSLTLIGGREKPAAAKPVMKKKAAPKKKQ